MLPFQQLVSLDPVLALSPVSTPSRPTSDTEPVAPPGYYDDEVMPDVEEDPPVDGGLPLFTGLEFFAQDLA